MKNLYFSMIVIQLIFFFLGIRLGWVLFQYDELRILELLFGGIAFVVLILKTRLIFSMETILIFGSIFFLIIYYISSFSIFQIIDLISLISLCSIFLMLSKSFHNLKFYFILIISAVIPCLFIFLSIYNKFLNGIWFDWQLNGGSIRIYDSTIVPIFYLTIYLKSIDYKHIVRLYPIIIVLIGLALFFDSARSALLSCTIPIILYCFLSEKYRFLLIKTLIFMFISFFIYWLFNLVYNVNNEVDQKLSISRLDSSLRNEIWNYSYELWLKNPWSGIGGGWLAQVQYPYGYHMHNFYLRMIFEWGVVGILFLYFVLSRIVEIIKLKNISPILIIGILGIAIDGLFSGNLIYPASQLICVLYISYVFSLVKKVDSDNNFLKFILSKILIILFGFLFFYILFFYILNDISCYQCGSFGGREAPNFWYYGASEKLIDGSKIP